MRLLRLLVLTAPIAILGSCASSPEPVSLLRAAQERVGEKPTRPFREEHVSIQEHLEHLAERLRSLPGAAPEDQRQTMQFIAQFLDEHIRSHAEWEESVLYPIVDGIAKSPPEHPFTATMRYEHGIIGRGIDALAQTARDPESDVARFGDRGTRLLGVIDAHFEKEENVFLPILDENMTQEEFEREIGSKMKGH